MNSQKNKEDLNFKGRDIKTTLDILWGLRNGDKFYFMSYGEDLIKSLNTQEVKATLKEVEKSLMSDDEIERTFDDDTQRGYDLMYGAKIQRNKTQELINKLKR